MVLQWGCGNMGVMGARDRVWAMIGRCDGEGLLDLAASIHGHYCPGLALGVLAGAELVRQLAADHAGMEDVIAVVETNNCFSDGIQVTTGCTFGNNALVYRDIGKNSVTLARRDGDGIRVTVDPGAMDGLRRRAPEFEAMFQLVVRERRGNEADLIRYSKLARENALRVLNTGSDALLRFEVTSVELPPLSPMHDTLICGSCGEAFMASRAVDGICGDCAQADIPCLDGRGIRCPGNSKT